MPCSANCATGVHACFGATSGTSSRSLSASGFVSAGGADGELLRTVELAVRRELAEPALRVGGASVPARTGS